MTAEIEMAHLTLDSDPKEWLEWAVELGRRGLWPDGEIVVHGPHEPHGFYWREAECQDAGDALQTVTFDAKLGKRDRGSSYCHPTSVMSPPPKRIATRVAEARAVLRKLRRGDTP